MALEMRGVCERCGVRLSAQGVAYICSFECTFCRACVRELKGACPNCGGELLRRPTRKEAPVAGYTDGGAVEAASAAAACPVAG